MASSALVTARCGVTVLIPSGIGLLAFAIGSSPWMVKVDHPEDEAQVRDPTAGTRSTALGGIATPAAAQGRGARKPDGGTAGVGWGCSICGLSQLQLGKYSDRLLGQLELHARILHVCLLSLAEPLSASGVPC